MADRAENQAIAAGLDVAGAHIGLGISFWGLAVRLARLEWQETAGEHRPALAVIISDELDRMRQTYAEKLKYVAKTARESIR